MRTPSKRRLRQLARRIQRQPWNRSGTDKTFVFSVLQRLNSFQRIVHR